MTAVPNEDAGQPLVVAKGLTKRYQIYSQPQDRLKQILWGGRKKYYREFTALENASFQVNRGETLGIVGKNGSGKSTLLQLVVGILKPSSGEVSVRGKVAALLELGAGFNPEFSGRENVYLNAGILGLSRAETQARFEDIAGFAEIGPYLDQPVKTYSSGMFIRLAFAVAVHVDAEILVVDEALAVGDESFQRKCFAKIQAFRKAGGTLLFVSHSASAVLELCERAICLDQGEMLFAGSPKQVIELYHKMIFAPSASLPQLKQQLKQELGDTRFHLEDPPETENTAAPKQRASFDPGLVSKSVTHYPSQGVHIVEPHLETLDGDQVNIIINREEYIYTYKVRFEREAQMVRFGMLIKSTSGLELGGASTATQYRGLELVEAGCEFNVRFRFRCMLAKGVYFLNAGVLGLVDEVETYLARHIDVALFRVQTSPDSLATCMVDFLIEPSAARCLNS